MCPCDHPTSIFVTYIMIYLFYCKLYLVMNKADVLIEHKADVLLIEHKADVLLMEHKADVLLIEHKDDILLIEHKTTLFSHSFHSL